MAHAWGHKGQRMRDSSKGDGGTTPQYEKGGKVEEGGLFDFPSAEGAKKERAFFEASKKKRKNK
tara:strand:+ start:168 stop:359 length:192 start_codon:yes stop_codon:yes gene_type:complete